jgi:hypothetical protein
MCHCFADVDELSESERAELVDEHSTDELEAELSPAELETLGIAG